MRVSGAIGALLTAILLVGCSDPADEPDDAAIPQAAADVMAKPAYSTARWLYYFADQETGEVLAENRSDEMVFTASTAKNFTVGTVYDEVGPDTTLTTPVYATAAPQNGSVPGLVLVAQGDLAFGGRGAMEGRMDNTFTATTADHVYGDVAPNAVTPEQDPLAGLDDLARQVAAKGINRVDGDVVIDTRIWETYAGHEGPVPPIFVNDNLLDIEITPGAGGATAQTTPATSAFTVRSEVTTGAADSDAAVTVSPDPADPRTLVVSGSVPEGKSHLTVYRIPDAAAWARTLFVEALARAGVTVTAPALAPNDESGLPPAGGYPEQNEVASLQSAPLKAFGTMILETSYNTGANALLCLLAARSGSTDCDDGLQAIRAAIDKAGIDSDAVVLVDGQGADPASTTPKQMTDWMTWAAEQPWGDSFVAGQPVLGESGTLGLTGADSPARGKIAAKTGTSAAGDPATGRTLFNVQALAGYLTADDGRRVVFGLSMSGGTYPDVLTGLTQSNDDVAAVAAAFQQQFSM